MATDENGDAAVELPPWTSYGPFVRIVEPGRHVYRTTMDFNGWLILIMFSGMAVVAGWVAFSTGFKTVGDSAFAGLFLLGALFCSAAAIIVVLGRVRLEITRNSVRIVKRGLFYGRASEQCWDSSAILGVGVTGMDTFHLGGSTALHSVVLRLGSGESVRFGSTFDELPAAESMMNDITDSLRRARDGAATF
jgi:hypothetical protein